MKNEDKWLDELLLMTRNHRPDTTPVENLFEVRVMAKIGEKGVALNKAWWEWDLWTWRLVPVFAAIAILVGMGGVFASSMPADFFTSFNNGYEDYLMTSMLGG